MKKELNTENSAEKSTLSNENTDQNKNKSAKNVTSQEEIIKTNKFKTQEFNESELVKLRRPCRDKRKNINYRETRKYTNQVKTYSSQNA